MKMTNAMNHVMNELIKFSKEMLENIENLKNGYCYKIFARNAYVGVWKENQKAFMISRYKMGANPFLFDECHWDTNDEKTFPFGTVKPIELIEKFPFELKENYIDSEEQQILSYLDALEENNSVIAGINTLQHRKQSAIRYEKKLEAKRRLAARLKRHGISIADYEKHGKARKSNPIRS
ncbi:MAG: hypothetical protein Q8N96_08660 [Methylovulum sp.]|nr:hypothetical protein [Methylovulum sp.]